MGQEKCFHSVVACMVLQLVCPARNMNKSVDILASSVDQGFVLLVVGTVDLANLAIVGLDLATTWRLPWDIE